MFFYLVNISIQNNHSDYEFMKTIKLFIIYKDLNVWLFLLFALGNILHVISYKILNMLIN